MKKVLAAVLLAQCVGCSTIHGTSKHAVGTVAAGGVAMAIATSLQTDVGGSDNPRTGNIRNVSGPIGTIYHLDAGTWRNSIQVLKTW